MAKTEQILYFSSIDREKRGVSKCEDFVTKFNPPIILSEKEEIKYEIAVDNLSMTYSWHNITPAYTNNQIKYSNDGGKTWFNINFSSGMYSYSDLNDYVHETMKKNNHGDEKFDINIRFLLTTYKVAIILSNNYQIDLRNSNFGDLIGFDEKLVIATEMSSRMPNITNFIDSVVIKTDLINQSIMSGKPSNTLFVFSTDNLRRSYPFTIERINKPFQPISTNMISLATFYILDSIGRPINLNNVNWNMTLILRSKQQ